MLPGLRNRDRRDDRPRLPDLTVDDPRPRLIGALAMAAVRISLDDWLRDGGSLSDRITRAVTAMKPCPMTGNEVADGRGEVITEAWAFVRKVLADTTEMITQDARDERELLEGLRVINRVATLCAPNCRWTPIRPTALRADEHTLPAHRRPQSAWLLSPGDDQRRPCLPRHREAGASTYHGRSGTAGTGLNQRRMSNYLSDSDLVLDDDGRFNLVFSAAEPSPAELAGAQWVKIPDDATSRSWCATTSPTLPPPFRRIWRSSYSKWFAGNAVDRRPAGRAADGDGLDDREEMTTLHRTVLPDLVDNPNRLVTSAAQALGSRTPPDNLYARPVRPRAGTKPATRVPPPETRYWSVTLENIWQ